LAHAFNNGAIVIITYLVKDLPDAENVTGASAMSLQESLLWIGALAPILAGLLYVFYKMTEPIQARAYADLAIEEYERAETEFSN